LPEEEEKCRKSLISLEFIYQTTVNVTQEGAVIMFTIKTMAILRHEKFLPVPYTEKPISK